MEEWVGRAALRGVWALGSVPQTECLPKNPWPDRGGRGMGEMWTSEVLAPPDAAWFTTWILKVAAVSSARVLRWMRRTAAESR